MELSQALATIKQLISEGKLEEAYNQLVPLLDAYAHFAELADIARVNQADLYQLKSQSLKGTITPEEARLTTNQLTDNALQLIRQLESGKASFGSGEQRKRSNTWLYTAIAGGVLILAAAAWFFLRPKPEAQDTCPAFSTSAELNVMILPFKQTGARKDIKPEFDLMDGLNDLIDKTPGLRVKTIADVHERYDIDKDYPNSAQAVEIARHCNAQMLVWGKVNQTSPQDYTLDVRYRLLDAGGVRSAGDTTISRLLTVTEEGRWIHDVQAVTHLLYMVLANQMQVPIAANILSKIKPVTATSATADALPSVDTTTSFVLADYYIRKKEADKAIAEYDKVLDADPNNTTALTRRGALLMQQADYSGAARDLEAASIQDKKIAPALHDARIQAYLKSGQPEKAQQEVETVRKEESAADGTWLSKRKKEVSDSIQALQKRRDVLERQVETQPKNISTRVEAAKANLGLGKTDEALKHSREVLRKDPTNVEAVQVAAAAHLQQGDTVKAAKVIESAEKAGVNVKSIKLRPLRQVALPEKKPQ